MTKISGLILREKFAATTKLNKVRIKSRSVSREVTHSPLGERSTQGSNLGPVKLDTVLPTAHHRHDISSKAAVLPAGSMTRKWAS